jgi:cyclophilin family peptidyl-prolyl cis-trans isomerase
MRQQEAAKTPQTTAADAAPTSGTRPGVVLALMGVLLVVVVGGGFLVYWLMGGGGGPNPQVVIETSEGTIRVELFESQAPITVKNFLQYVDEKHYDGTIFHRVIPDFMIQGGGFEPGLKEKGSKFAAIKNEGGNGLKNERGTLAMARTPDPDSATDQFFINLKYNDFLDRAKAQDKMGYAVFGKVIEGMDVVDKIARVRTETRLGQKNVPEEDVTIKSIRRVEKK